MSPCKHPPLSDMNFSLAEKTELLKAFLGFPDTDALVAYLVEQQFNRLTFRLSGMLQAKEGMGSNVQVIGLPEDDWKKKVDSPSSLDLDWYEKQEWLMKLFRMDRVELGTMLIYNAFAPLYHSMMQISNRVAHPSNLFYINPTETNNGLNPEPNSAEPDEEAPPL